MSDNQLAVKLGIEIGDIITISEDMKYCIKLLGAGYYLYETPRYPGYLCPDGEYTITTIKYYRK